MRINCCVGIDRAVNVALLERLAGYGGGHFDLVESEDRLDEVLGAVHRRLGAPVLTELRLEPALREMAPEVTDLFPGVPLRLGGQWPGSPPAQVTVTGRTADGGIFRQTLTPVATTDNAVQTLWARARVLDLEHQFAATNNRDSGLSDAITAFSLKYAVLCRFTAFVAVDRAEVVNPGGELHQVVQPVELPSQWAMPGMAGVACAPPSPMRRSIAQLACMVTGTSSEMDDLDYLAEEPERTLCLGPSSSEPLPPWFERLETLANAPVLDTAELLMAVKEALQALEAMGKSAAKLVKAGREIVRLLEKGLDGRLSRFKTWLPRVKERLERKAGGKLRGAWWK